MGLGVVSVRDVPVGVSLSERQKQAQTQSDLLKLFMLIKCSWNPLFQIYISVCLSVCLCACVWGQWW